MSLFTCGKKRSHLLSRDSLSEDNNDVLGYFPFPARGNFRRESLSLRAVCSYRDPKNLNRGGSVASSSVQTQGGVTVSSDGGLVAGLIDVVDWSSGPAPDP